MVAIRWTSFPPPKIGLHCRLWKPGPVFTYVGIGSTSDRTTHPTIQQITRRPASHKEVRLHSECLQALANQLPLRQKPRRGQRNLARVAKSEHRKDLIFDCYFFWQQSPISVTLLVSFAYRSWILLWKRLYFSKVWRTDFFFIRHVYQCLRAYYISPCSIVQHCIFSSKPNQHVLYNSIVSMPMG